MLPRSLRYLWAVSRGGALRAAVYLCLAVLLVILVWRLALTLRAPKAVAIEGQTAQTIGVARIPQRVNVEEVADQHLFGMAPVAVSSAPIMAAAGIRVIGIITAEDPKQSWAILDMGGDQHMYQAGTLLPDGEKLLAVQPDRVVLVGHGDPYSVMWDMHPADANAAFPILNLSTSGDFSNLPAPVAGAIPHTLTQETLSALRAQLLAKPRPPLPARNQSEPRPKAPPS